MNEFGKIDLEKLILIVNLGVLHSLRNNYIDINEAEYFLYTPYMLRLLKENNYSIDLINMIHKGTELEDLKGLNIDFKNEVDNILSKLSLEESLLNKKPYELSGGQLQRCSILRAILLKPDLLLIDEPTSALDNIIAYDTMKLIVNLLSDCGILLVTHDIDMASWCSNEIIRLENGK